MPQATLVIGLVLMAACRPGPWTGPLAAEAERLLPSSTKLTCEEWIGSPTPANSAAVGPFRECSTNSADTIYTLMLARDRYVVWIGRNWRPPEGQSEAYDRLVAQFTQAHGPAHLCPQSDEVAVWQDRQWQLPGYRVAIVRLDRDKVAQSFRVGLIGCHVL